MVVTGWWGLIRSRGAEGVPQWQKGVGLAGAAANTALAIPLGWLLYRMHYPFLPIGVCGESMANADRVVLTSLVLSLSALIAGIFAPPALPIRDCPRWLDHRLGRVVNPGGLRLKERKA